MLPYNATLQQCLYLLPHSYQFLVIYVGEFLKKELENIENRK